jgi:hypothetical protein
MIFKYDKERKRPIVQSRNPVTPEQGEEREKERLWKGMQKKQKLN